MQQTKLLDLIPQSPETILPNLESSIKVIGLLSYSMREAVNTLKLFFFDKKFNLFDPHVGDASCQIRAYYFMLLSPQLMSYKEWVLTTVNKLNKLVIISENLLNDKNRINEFYSKENKLNKLLRIINIEIDIPEKVVFLYLSFFLTRFKRFKKNGDTYIDYESICHNLEISRKMAKKIVHSYQEKLSYLSSKFIIKLAYYLDEYKRISFIFKKMMMKDDDARFVLPCYWSMKIMLAHMLKHHCPILIITHRICYNESDNVVMLFLPDIEQNNYSIQEDFLYFDPNLPCFIIEGITEYENNEKFELQAEFIARFRQQGIKKILLSYMASHPQYMGKKLKSISANPLSALLTNKEDELWKSLDEKNNLVMDMEDELNYYKTISEIIGCSDKNKSLFFIRHVFFDAIKNHIKSFSKISELTFGVNFFKKPHLGVVITE